MVQAGRGLRPACSAFFGDPAPRYPKEPTLEAPRPELSESPLVLRWSYPAGPLLSVPLPLSPGLSLGGVRHRAGCVPWALLEPRWWQLLHHLFFLYPPHKK